MSDFTRIDVQNDSRSFEQATDVLDPSQDVLIEDGEASPAVEESPAPSGSYY